VCEPFARERDTRPVKVVFVNKYASVTGGADRHAIELAGLLSARGHEVRFLAFRPPDDFPFEGEYIDARVTHDTRETIGRVEAIKAATSIMWNREAAAAMRRLIEGERPDLVHIHKIYPQLSVAPAVTAARRSIPIVQDAADYEFISASAEDSSGGRVDRSSSRLAYRAVNTASFALRRRFHVPRVGSWIVASSFMQRTYARHGIDADVLPYFLPNPDDHRHAGFRERRGIAFLGRLVRVKGVSDVIEVARRHPGLTVTIAGAGEQEEYVRREIARVPNLRFEGYLDSPGVNRLLAQSRVALMPSRWQEPAGLAALEAMARGTPVVAYSCGGLADYIASNGGGILVREGDMTALADAAAWLHEDEARWTKLSTEGQAGVRSNHDPNRYAQRLEQIYATAADARYVAS
jgi:glycosyltransferase involved in cell wall biosynthesis